MTFVPGGAMGVRLKSKLPNKYAYAESFGLTRLFRSKFNVITAWGRRRSHSAMGNLGSMEARPAIK